MHASVSPRPTPPDGRAAAPVDVARVFERNEILLLGANGFVGKVLLAMLLDRYPSLRRVHVLLRPRAGQRAEQRFEQEVLSSPVFKPLLEGAGRNFVTDKLAIWEGDISRPYQSISTPERVAWKGAGLVINCAGLVEFFAPLDDSLRANVDAAVNAASLAKDLGAKLLHISTCYVAGKADGLIEESDPIAGFYPLRASPDDRSFDYRAELERLRERIAQITDDGKRRDRAATEALVELGRARARRWGWVNTYTFSKSLGEQALAGDADLDLAIVRPAIVESALHFPFPGWVEGGRTAAPLVLMALGGMKNWPARPDLSLEVVPVDQVAAAILSVGALLVEDRAEPVYHLASSDCNPFEMSELLPLLDAEARRRGGGSRGRLRLLPYEQYSQRATGQRTRAEELEKRLMSWSERLGKLGLPGARLLAAKAGVLRKAALQTHFRERVIEQYLPFILENRYVFESAAIRRAAAQLTEADQERLPWSPEEIDWRKYWIENQVKGVLEWVQPETVREWDFRL